MQTKNARQLLTNCFSMGLACFIFLLAGAKEAYSEDGWGEFDGAIWKVHLTPQIAGRGPKAPKAVPMTGHFRVEKLQLYQSEGRRDKELGRKVGKSYPDKKRNKPHTIVELTDLAVHNRDDKNNAVRLKMSGKATLFKEEKEQKGKGVFVEDEGGWKWDMEITRVRE